MSWYKDVLWQNCRKELTLVGILFIILLTLSVVQLIHGNSFTWQEVKPFGVPNFWARAFWSALTFVTLGALLYRLYFYKVLWWIFGRDKSTHKKIKYYIWAGLMYINYQMFPVVVDSLNLISTLVFNFIVFVMYTSPLLLLGLVAGIVLGIIMERGTIMEFAKTEELLGK